MSGRATTPSKFDSEFLTRIGLPHPSFNRNRPVWGGGNSIFGEAVATAAENCDMGMQERVEIGDWCPFTAK